MAAPLTVSTEGAATFGGAHEASIVVSTAAVCPFAGMTRRRTAYGRGSAGVKVAGFEARVVKVLAGTDDHANVYVVANRGGHSAGSESAEKNAPLAGDAVTVQGSIGLAPPACVALTRAMIGLAPQASLANVVFFDPTWFH